jgi:hypothetical protein
MPFLSHAFFVVSLILSGPSHQAIARDPARDDAQVVSAVLAQTVRREVDKLLARSDGWRGSPLVVLLDRTIAMCPDRTGPWENCVEGSTLPPVREPWWTPALSDAFRTRNARSVTAPAVTLPNVVSAPYEGASGRRPPDLHPTAAGWVSVSLPAYTQSGQAVLFVDFACGAMCCHAWFIVLDSTAGGWRVAREIRVSIC